MNALVNVAPIFQTAEPGLVANGFAAMPELTEGLN